MKKTLLLLVVLMLLVVGCTLPVIEEGEIPIEEEIPIEPEEPIEEEIFICEDLCGDGFCAEVVCLAEGCPCAETEDSCPQDCEEPEVEIVGPPIEEWCVPDSTFTTEENGETVDAIIQGPEEYKGKTYCRGRYVTPIKGTDILTTYYFSYEHAEEWVLRNIAGIVEEEHFIYGELVE